MLRSELTVSEAALWAGIKNKAAGARFRRQVPIGIWIVDFASFHPKLVIEVDDPSHDWRDEIERTRYLEALGFAVLRFTNKEIATEIGFAIETVEHWIESLKSTGQPPQ
jgi:very-short-patch-repair endonuclease